MCLFHNGQGRVMTYVVLPIALITFVVTLYPQMQLLTSNYDESRSE